jgi:hypothetical protein
MKSQPIIYLIIILLTCRCKTDELPSEALINDVIYSTVIQDSLNRKMGIVKYIDIPDVYSLQEWDGDQKAPPPPPPPSIFGYSFKELLTCFNAWENSNMRISDSIFIIHQIDTTLKYNIQDRIYSMFTHEIPESYFFSRPIFSYDKKTAIVAYHNGNFRGYKTILHKVKRKWVIMNHRATWMR